MKKAIIGIAIAAGLFTIAVNTGPLKDSTLIEAGAGIVFSSMQELCDEWEKLHATICNKEQNC